jgi:hypothetical protein
VAAVGSKYRSIAVGDILKSSIAVPLLLEDRGVEVERPLDGLAEVAMPDMICFVVGLCVAEG